MPTRYLPITIRPGEIPGYSENIYRQILGRIGGESQPGSEHVLSPQALSGLRLGLVADGFFQDPERDLVHRILNSYDALPGALWNNSKNPHEVLVAKIANTLCLTPAVQDILSGIKYVDAWGREFQVDIISTNNSPQKRVVLRQKVSYPRSPEWLYIDDLKPMINELFKSYDDLYAVEVQYESTEPNTGYSPSPAVILRENQYLLSLEDHYNKLVSILRNFGMRPVDASLDGEQAESSPNLPVFSLRDGRRRFVAYYKPDTAPNLPESVGVNFLEVKPNPAKVAILVSQETHALEDLLRNFAAGFMNGIVSVVLGNHDSQSIRDLCSRYGVEFVPIVAKPADHKARLLDYLKQVNVRPDLIVLAKYMQILTAEFIEEFGSQKIINVHHGLLPAFQGARPYEQGQDRGVEVFGATAHYATRDLDAGPLITQEAAIGSSTTGTAAIRRKDLGRMNESRALTRAVQAWLRGRLKLLYERTETREDPHHKGSSIEKYLGLVVDAPRLMYDLALKARPGDLIVRQLGDSFESDGPLTDEYIRQQLELNTGQFFSGVNRIRFMPSRGPEIHLIPDSSGWKIYPDNASTDGLNQFGVGPDLIHLGAQTFASVGGVNLQLPVRPF